MQWKLNKITNNHNKKEAWRSPSFASFSHLALCSLPDLVPVRGAPELLHFWSCNTVTAISEFLLLSSFIVLFWLFFLWMAWRSKWLLADVEPQLEDDRKCAVVAQVKGGHTKASLKSLVAILKITIWVLLFQISHSYVSHWVFSELWGGGYESLRMEITIVEPKGLLFDPPLDHHTKVTCLHFILVQCQRCHNTV